MQGTIARKTDRGFGFIKPDEGDKDIFFHAKAVVNTTYDSLKEGDRVSFEVEQGRNGPAAANVNLI